MQSGTIVYFSLHQTKNRNKRGMVLTSTKQLLVAVLARASANSIVLHRSSLMLLHNGTEAPSTESLLQPATSITDMK